MKIGILTQPLLNNYGGLLQNYALQQVLKRMGHKVDTLDWAPMKADSMRELLWQKKELLLSFFSSNHQKPRYRLTVREQRKVSEFTHQFIDNYLSVCLHKAKTIDDFQKLDVLYKYDAYIVGSDQVWRPSYNSSIIPAMFLSFVSRDDIKRIAYAASFGTSNWEFTEQQTELCAQLAKRFDLITVREESGVKLCKEHFGVDATHVLDPTMLLNHEDYEKIVAEENEPVSEGGLFHYILDPSEDKKGLINHIADCQGLKPFTIMPKCQAENRTKWDVKHRIEDCVFPSVTSWLRGFMDAKMVVIDSFHGAVFSIIFNKPFWVVGNSKRGNARFESLLGMFDLQDRMVNPSGIEKVDWNKAIDWGKVNEIRQTEALRSLVLLTNELS